MKEPRNTILASRVSITDKRETVAAAALEGISVSTFTRNAVMRACQERLAKSVRGLLPAEGAP